MGTIIAVQKENSIAIGTNAWNLRDTSISPANSKEICSIIQYGSSYIGLNSSIAFQQAFECALRQKLIKKDLPLSNTDEIYLFFHQLHEVLNRNFYMYVNFSQGQQEFEWTPMTALIINTNGIFKIDSNRSVYHFENFWALGNGESYAFGALEAVYPGKKSSRIVLQDALKICSKLENLDPAMITVREIKIPHLKVAVKSAKKSRTAKGKSKKPKAIKKA